MNIQEMEHEDSKYKVTFELLQVRSNLHKHIIVWIQISQHIWPLIYISHLHFFQVDPRMRYFYCTINFCTYAKYHTVHIKVDTGQRVSCLGERKECFFLFLKYVLSFFSRFSSVFSVFLQNRRLYCQSPVSFSFNSNLCCHILIFMGTSLWITTEQNLTTS